MCGEVAAFWDYEYHLNATYVRSLVLMVAKKAEITVFQLLLLVSCLDMKNHFNSFIVTIKFVKGSVGIVFAFISIFMGLENCSFFKNKCVRILFAMLMYKSDKSYCTLCFLIK